MTIDPFCRTQAIQDALQQSYLFNFATPMEINSISNIAEWVFCTKKTRILEEGTPCDALFILARGKLVVKEVITGDAELIIARITPGDVVGEMSMMDSKAASATVTSDGPAELVRLSYSGLAKLFQENPTLELLFQRALVGTLVDRMRKTNNVLRSIVGGGILSRL